MIFVLYNPYADNCRGKTRSLRVSELTGKTDIEYLDITTLNPIEFIQKAGMDDQIILSGGDGTLFHFINQLDGKALEHPVFYYPAGSGNDFMTDVKDREKDELVLLNPYIADLPTVTVNDQTYYFLNGVGYGIDSYCCEEGDKQRQKGKGSINYTSIAIKGLLFHYKPRNAIVNVDGVEHRYKNVWLAPTMNGRYYGGGMMVAPAQNRLNEDHTVTLVVMFKRSKMKTLMVFPSIFKGGHVRHTDMVKILTGHRITVSFDKPAPLQIDGETVSGVTSYSVNS